MKINEAIQMPLFESFGDLKRFIDQYFVSIFGTTEPKIRDWRSMMSENPVLFQENSTLVLLHDDLKRHIPDLPSPPTNSKAFLEVIRFIIKDQRIQKPQTVTDTGNWIRLFKMSTTSNHFIPYNTVQQIYERTIEHLVENPPKQKPKITEITKTQHSHIFELENFEAAVKVKNTFGVRWCIGVDRGWFNRYGEEMGRKTYVVSLPNKKVFAVHSGDSLLITPHDNNSEVNASGVGRGDGMRGVIDQMREAGFDDEDIPDVVIGFLKKLKAPYTSAFIREMERVLSSNSTDILDSLFVVVGTASMGGEDILKVDLWHRDTKEMTTELFGIHNDRVINPRTGEAIFLPGGRTGKIDSIVMSMIEEVVGDDFSHNVVVGVVSMMRDKVRQLTNTHNLPQEYYLMFNKLRQVLGG